MCRGVGDRATCGHSTGAARTADADRVGTRGHHGRQMEEAACCITHMISKMCGTERMGRPTSWFGPSCFGCDRVDLAYLTKHGCLRPGYASTLHWSRGDQRVGSIGYLVEAGGLRLRYISKSPDGLRRQVDELIP